MGRERLFVACYASPTLNLEPTVPFCLISTSLIFTLFSSLLSQVQSFITRGILTGTLTMNRGSVYGLLYPRPLDFPTFEFRLLTLLLAD
jgi:hypothetical protein